MRVRIGPYRKNRAKHVEIEPHDTWNMDRTLALIIHPMLVQLKETTHGYPVDLTEQEWDDILDKMIWAFEQKNRDDWEDDKGIKAHQERMTNGFKLFGKYFESLWD